LTETEFIRQNKDKWNELESLLEQKNKDANTLHKLFVKVSSDLSYARTYFPNRSVRLYLNNLTQEVFNSLGKKKKNSIADQLKVFFTQILPLEIYRSKQAFLISFLVFTISLGIGVFSSIHNPEFATIILGKQYIEMTDENIANDDPMAVYKDERKLDMFFGITFNNIRVAFMAFVVGLFGSIGTLIILISNGIMVGAFQYYFYAKGYFLTSFLTIWIHGTIEISAIIIAGAAGIILGNGLLFPKTHSRTSSLQIASRRALRILLGTVPLFIIAGLLESFVTRLTDLPMIVKIGIIGMSFAFIVFMFIIYPYLQYKNLGENEITNIDIEPYYSSLISFEKRSFKTMNEIFTISFTQFREYFQTNITYICLPAVLITSVVLWFKLHIDGSSVWADIAIDNALYNFEYGGIFVFILLANVFYLSTVSMTLYYRNNGSSLRAILIFIKNHSILALPLCFIATALYYFIPGWLGLILSVLFFCQVLIPILEKKTNSVYLTENRSVTTILSENFSNIVSYALIYAVIYAAFLFIQYIVSSPIVGFLASFIHWHSFFEDGFMSVIYINHLITIFSFLLFFPLIYFLYINQYYSIESKVNSIDLRDRFKEFGTSI